mmetsp:Transcript_46871/g.77821  ORF Transcript_46871/g.77821 Transcript_46871/m.77821 type:complete len:1034 (+) Transcript_46871:38-3139(+)|eukprot:CAMPEP_0202712990 /NCGR_PEP_ID=MMETSP1385-20130828/48127_1 /ASSEMBLY_ACC=CAM_ASM_000861 /TAXON_ID=933848 /ORGANISM="Elphidium margaritaceum" /LENGTH=1033 /DNA_ID=CAMNT_0049373203 /DNA_START=31 /DNA_END=3132 /DNA_ORIENTATION=-
MSDAISKKHNNNNNEANDIHMFDSIEIQPAHNNFGTLTKQTRPTVKDLSMGHLEQHFTRHADQSADVVLEDQEVEPNGTPVVDPDQDTDGKHSASKKSARNKPQKKFGTLDGVLARCLLCIWGVIMYLRTGWIVGNAGIWQTTIIMLLATSVTFFTSLSLSAICTNGEVKSGGYYFIISRSLGPEFGGVIGILFAFANCISVAMYLAGFAETIVAQYTAYVTGSSFWDIVLWAEVTLSLILLLALRGVAGIIKFDMVLIVVLIISIIVYFVGTFGVTAPQPDTLGYTGYASDTFRANWNADYVNDETNFITVFAVFFPAVTGEMAGANISGDLKKPEVNIPVGTISAILISTVVYIGIAWSLGGCVLRNVGDSETAGLWYDYQIMPKISAWAPLVIVGIFASTLSSGMSCFVGAPRIFQAVCQDNLFPSLRYFAKGRDHDGEPVRAYFIVYVICFLAILTGNINIIAPIITNFFLVTYAVMNACTFMWSVTNSPGWRPTFKFYNKWISLLASIECVVLMFLIDWLMALITVVIGVLLYQYVAYINPNVEWGTASEALAYVQTSNKLLKYQANKAHAKIERPKFLIFNRSLQHLQQMYAFTQTMNQKFHGMTTVGDVVVGSHKDPNVTNTFVRRARDHHWDDIPVEIAQNSLIETCIASTFVEGVRTVLQTAGIGPIRPNVAVFNVKDFSTEHAIAKTGACKTVALKPPKEQSTKRDDEHDATPDYIHGLQDALLTGMGVLLVAGHEYIDWSAPRTGFIDIWWLYDDGGLTVLIPYLIQSHRLWRDCHLRIMAIENLGISEQNELANLISKLRIKAEIVEVGDAQNLDVQTDSVDIGTDEADASKKTVQHEKTPHDDVDADFPLIDNDNDNDDDDDDDRKGADTEDTDHETAAADIHNTFFQSKLPKSSYMDQKYKAKSLRHEVFTYDDISDLNPDNQHHNHAKSTYAQQEMYDILHDAKITDYARRKLMKYMKLGQCIARSRDSALCVVTMPFPKSEYTSYEYSKILQCLTPKNMSNLIFVRGNQDQVLTFAL